MRYFFLSTLLFFCLAEGVTAQQLVVINGIIAMNSNNERIAGVLVKNIRTGELKISSNTGLFTIKAFVGDTISFSKANYADHRLPVTSTADLTVFFTAGN